MGSGVSLLNWWLPKESGAGTLFDHCGNLTGGHCRILIRHRNSSANRGWDAGCFGYIVISRPSYSHSIVLTVIFGNAIVEIVTLYQEFWVLTWIDAIVGRGALLPQCRLLTLLPHRWYSCWAHQHRSGLFSFHRSKPTGCRDGHCWCQAASCPKRLLW